MPTGGEGKDGRWDSEERTTTLHRLYMCVMLTPQCSNIALVKSLHSFFVLFCFFTKGTLGSYPINHGYFLWVLAPSAYMLWKAKDNGTKSKLFRPAAKFCCCLVWWSQTLAELYGWQLQAQMSTNLLGSLNHSLSGSKIYDWLFICTVTLYTQALCY